MSLLESTISRRYPTLANGRWSLQVIAERAERYELALRAVLRSSRNAERQESRSHTPSVSGSALDHSATTQMIDHLLYSSRYVPHPLSNPAPSLRSKFQARIPHHRSCYPVYPAHSAHSAHHAHNVEITITITITIASSLHLPRHCIMHVLAPSPLFHPSASPNESSTPSSLARQPAGDN
jgi:hypothetical protein